jgi:hypothetical protein
MMRVDSNPLGLKGLQMYRALRESATVMAFSVHNCQFEIESNVDFDQNNPTGHYSLDLNVNLPTPLLTRQSPHDKAIAERLFKLAQASSFDAWRNEAVDGKRVQGGAGFAIPPQGTLELDFVDLNEPPEEAKAMGGEEFEALRRGLTASVSDVSRVAVVRDAAGVYFFDSIQALTVAMFFSADKQKVRGGRGEMTGGGERDCDHVWARCGPQELRLRLKHFVRRVAPARHVAAGCDLCVQLRRACRALRFGLVKVK